MKTLAMLLMLSLLIGCAENPVEPYTLLEVTEQRVLSDTTALISYRAPIVNGVAPRVFLFVNDSWEFSPTTRFTYHEFEYGTIIYPTEKPPIPVLYSFWGNEFRYIDLSGRT